MPISRAARLLSSNLRSAKPMRLHYEAAMASTSIAAQLSAASDMRHTWRTSEVIDYEWMIDLSMSLVASVKLKRT